jgi:SAM-dependent methyltransferase
MGRFPEGAHAEFEGIREGHFWFETRRRALAGILGPLAMEPDFRGLEVGCGDGFVLEALRGARWVGADQSWGDAVRARRRTGRPIVVAAGERLPFRPRFAAVCAFDVLEHAEDDALLARALAAALRPGGVLALSVPAGPELWSSLDRYAGHYRRYTRASLEKTVTAAGLEVERTLPLFRLLWPLAWVRARLPRGRGEVESPGSEYGASALTNALLRSLLLLEVRLFGRTSWGRGTSLCLVARRREKAAEDDAGVT